MDAITLLIDQHENVMGVFRQYAKTADLSTKQRLFEEVADQLAAHATIEEKIFYPAAFAVGLRSDLRVAVEEHLAAKRLMSNLLGMSPDHEQFDAKMTVLRRLIEEHVAEEQGELLPRCRLILSHERLEELGAEMEAVHARLMQGSPRNGVPGEVLEAAPLHGERAPDEQEATARLTMMGQDADHDGTQR